MFKYNSRACSMDMNEWLFIVIKIHIVVGIDVGNVEFALEG